MLPATGSTATVEDGRIHLCLAVDLIDELRGGRDPARMQGPDAPPLQGFSVNGVVCTPNCG